MFQCFACEQLSDYIRMPQYQCALCGSSFVRRINNSIQIGGENRRPQLRITPSGEIVTVDRPRVNRVQAVRGGRGGRTRRNNNTEITRRMSFLVMTDQFEQESAAAAAAAKAATPPDDDDDDTDVCAICLESYTASMFQTPCHHLFHGECIKKWLEKKNSCPICVAAIAPPDADAAAAALV